MKMMGEEKEHQPGPSYSVYQAPLPLAKFGSFLYTGRYAIVGGSNAVCGSSMQSGTYSSCTVLYVRTVLEEGRSLPLVATSAASWRGSYSSIKGTLLSLDNIFSIRGAT